MLLTQEDIDEFKAIYKREFGEELDNGEARIMAEQLLRLYALLAKPLPSERKDQTEK